MDDANTEARGMVEAELRGLIEQAEQDAIDDANAAIESGERTDLWQYDIEISLDLAKRIVAALSATLSPQAGGGIVEIIGHPELGTPDPAYSPPAPADNAGLVEALRPFAAVAEHDIGDDEADPDLFRPMHKHNKATSLTVGDMRRALSAVRANGAEQTKEQTK